MEFVRLLLVLILLGRAIYTDVKSKRIENRWLLLFLGFAWLIAYIQSDLSGLLESLAKTIIVLVALFVLFVIRGLGAGDIKLCCVLGAFYPKEILNIIILAFIVAAVMSIGKMLLRALKKQSMYVPGEIMNFSIPIGIAAAIVIMHGWI